MSIMKNLSFLTICMVALFLCGTGSGAMISLGDLSIGTFGQKVELPVTLDTAPEGVSGYKFTTVFSDPGIARVSSVIMPDWASLKMVEGTPGQDVIVAALDLNMKVEAGATSIVLCSLVIEGLSQGSSSLDLLITEITDDSGFPIDVQIEPAMISVSGSDSTVAPVQTPPPSNQVDVPFVTPQPTPIPQPVAEPVEYVQPIVTPTPVPTVSADFFAQVREGEAPLTVLFTDNSTGYPNRFMWDFGDNSRDSTSPVQNPQHIYRTPGVYSVNLTASNSEYSNTTVKTDYITVRPMHLPERGAKNNITIYSVPEGAEVYLNNAYQGITPVFVTDLTTRQYQLRLHKDGYYDVVSPVQVREGVLPTFISGYMMIPNYAEIGRLVAEPPQTGAAYIVSYPELATVLINDQVVGKTDIMVTSLPVGVHNLSLLKDGFEPWNDMIEIKNGLTVIQTYHYEQPYFPLNRSVEYVELSG